MKKIIFTIIGATFLFISCEKEGTINTPEEQVDMSNFTLVAETTPSLTAGRQCHSMEVLSENLAKDPSLAERMRRIELFSRTSIQNRMPPGGGNGNGNNGGGGGDPVIDELGSIDIPVIVHVIYANSAQNISDSQINSQIDVLNNDFNATNSDLSQLPSEFQGVVGDVDVNFTLDQVIRVSANTANWGTNDAMKFSSNGGSDVVTPDTHLNVWVCNIGGGILGYAQFPGGSASTDGVVVSPQYFGTNGTAQAPFDGGRTATHEVGHYLNLRHIWGDGRCNKDDFVSDTPRSDAPNYGCPNYPTENCRSNDMTMNYMDYVYDECMYMFSEGQKVRMRTIFFPGGPRDTFMP